MERWWAKHDDNNSDMKDRTNSKCERCKGISGRLQGTRSTLAISERKVDAFEIGSSRGGEVGDGKFISKCF